MPVITLNNGQSVYVTEDQYVQLLQTQNQTAMQPQSALDFGAAGGLIGLTDLSGGAGAASGGMSLAAPVGIGPVASGTEYGSMLAGEAGGVLGAATPYLGVAGAGLGAYGLYNAMQEGDEKSGAMSGAGLGAGLAAAAPLLGFGPVGWGGLALAGGIGALGGYGLSSMFGDGDKYKTEYNRAQTLRDKGINWNLNTQEPTKGRSKEELIAWENEKAARGEYANPIYAQTGNLADSKAEDWWGYAAWGENIPEWLQTTEANRKAITQKALDLGLIDPEKGSMNLNFTPELEEYAKGLIEKPLPDEQAPGANNIPSSIPQSPKQRKPKPPPPVFGGGVPSNPAANLQPYSSRYSPLSFQGMLETMRGGRHA